jgi:hypothetical protein
MLKKISYLLFSGLLFLVVLFGSPVLAQAQPAQPNSDPLSVANPQTSAFLTSSGVKVTSVAGITGAIITVVLGLLGIVFVGLLIYAGIQWMTAEGNEEKVEHSKNTISRAIIGLLIVIAAYSITFFVFNAINKASGSGSNQGPNINAT